MGFLIDRDYEGIPEDDRDAFAHLESISRDRLHRTEKDRDGDPPWDAVMSYMNEIAALAEQFDIPGIQYDDECDNYRHEYSRFTRAVDYRLAQIRVQRARKAARQSVEISGPGRQKIQHYLEKLKAEIEAADIPAKRKRALLDRLAEFEVELAKRRFDLVKAMALIALVAAAANDFVGVFKDAPNLIGSITQVIGAEAVAEDERRPQLAKPEPFRAIPDMRPQPPAQDSKPALDLDDDVPF